ncbi:MAG: sodium/substrate symporter small subunit [Cyanobacteria bacterium P01_F01_bin.86]
MPFTFWIPQQGFIYVFVISTFIYAVQIKK